MPGESPLSLSNEEHIRLLNALRESELLRELSALLASSLDTTHILQVLVRRTTEVCDVERCAVWLLDDQQAMFLLSAYHLTDQRAGRKSAQIAQHIWRRSSLPFNDPVIHRLLQEGGMLALEDLQLATSKHMRTIARKFLVHSVLLIALIREDRPVGLMSLDNPRQYTLFSPDHQQLARAIGQQAAIAIHNARLYQQAQTERQRAERLIDRAQSIYRVAMAVNSGKDLALVLDTATQHLLHGLEAKSVAIVLIESGRLSLANISRQKNPSSPLPGYLAPPLEELSHCYIAATEGMPAFVPQELIQGTEQRWFQQLGMENVLIVPLLVSSYNDSNVLTRTALFNHTHCVGFAFVSYSKAKPEPTPGQYAFSLDIATQCALAIEKSQILTEVHQAATLATERANTLDAVFNAMTEGIMVIDMHGEMIVGNNTARRFLSLPSDTTISLSYILQHCPFYTLQGQSISPENFPLSRALQGEQIHGERFITMRADNSERMVEVNVAPLLDSTGCQIGIVGAFRDVTEQVRVERRIRRALDTMLHAVEIVSGITDIKDILHRVLAMTLTTLNCDRGIVLLYQPEKQAFQPLLSLGFKPEAEEQWLAEQQRWLAPTEDQYADFRTQLFSGHATLISGEQFSEQPNPFQDTMILAAPIAHNNQLQGVMLFDRSSKLKRERHPEPGATRFLTSSIFNIWDIAVVEGITQFAGLAIEQARWQEEAEIAHTNEAIMRQSNSLKDEFLAITAHEFRTPLTIILAHSQMIARALRKAAAVEPKLREKLDEGIPSIEQQARQLTNIVNTFLEVTLLNRGQIALQQEEINLEEIAKQVVAEHATTSLTHQIEYVVEPSERPYLVLGDKARLLQIFANLIQNAIKYSPLGGPITVSLMQRSNDEAKMVAEVQVQDAGIGIPQDAQARLFERFYRAANVEGSQTRGIGLGLYVVAEFLHLHGGTIHVQSSGIPGEGSRFIFTLPLVESKAR
ncbi:MAG: GAF domain-containing protein [Chloroflexi bacterium]|nr:MAG: GAF domain-containing protein [Chloroflexota bacterium]